MLQFLYLLVMQQISATERICFGGAEMVIFN